MSRSSVFVSGPALRVAVIGAYLARRWLSPGRRLVLSPSNVEAGADILRARPDHLRFHSELGVSLDALIKEAGARPLLASYYESARDKLSLPFLPVGPAQGGVEFQHYWCRANRIVEQPDLLSFSPAIALQHVDDGPSWAHIQKGATGFGLALRQQDYVRTLLNVATQLGGVVTADEASVDENSVTFDCSGVVDPGWTGSIVALRQASALPGIDWQISVNAARRFVDMSSSSAHCASEQREYSRLAGAEARRIADMEELLCSHDLRSCVSPTLRRKVELFEACGRIPSEDFEVFSQPEWIVALWYAGIRPRRYDRMADRMPEAQLMAMIEEQKRQVQAINRMEENA